MTPLAGRLAVVTGASRGIGLATAEALRSAGARVIRVARSLAAGTAQGFVDLACDVSLPDSVARLGEKVLAELGVPDILVNNAGTFDRIPFEQASVDEFSRQLQVNLVGAFAVARAFVPAMHRAGQGLVVSVGSVADSTGFPFNSVYAASKYGLRGLHEALLAEYRDTGVRFSLVSPGPTDTSIWDPVAATGTSSVRPRDRMLKPADVAEAILFVATRPGHVNIESLRMMPTGKAVSGEQ